MATCDFNRDCTSVPIPAKCVSYCLAQILRQLTVEEKQLVLGLSGETAEALFNAFNSDIEVNTFEDLEPQLTESQTAEVVERFERITQYQLNYCRLPMEDRQPIINSLRGLDLNSGLLLGEGAG